MNNTIEREFYVSDYAIEQYKTSRHGTINQNLSTYECDSAPNKIKIIIEVPEKKVTISESEFDKAWQALTYSELDSHWADRFRTLKQKLFAGGEG